MITVWSTQMTNPYHNGWNAYYDGVINCPYDPDTEMWDEWWTGWETAMLGGDDLNWEDDWEKEYYW